MGDAPPAPAVFFSERKHCLLHLLWGLAGRALGTARSIRKICFPLSEEAPDSPPRRIAGDGRSSGCFPEATTLLEGAYDLQSELRFALLVGELTGSGERKCQHGGTSPFMAVCGRCHTPSRTHQTPLSLASRVGHHVLAYLPLPLDFYGDTFYNRLSLVND